MSGANDYAAKIAALEEAKARVGSLIAGLPDSPEKKALQEGWRRTSITNILEGTSIPKGSLPRKGEKTFSINGLLWAPAKEVGIALNAYHMAYKAARFAFNAKTAAGEVVSPPEP
jgi:hypothetical protein